VAGNLATVTKWCLPANKLIVYCYQPGLSGINLGKFLLKRVIEMLRRDMPSVQVPLPNSVIIFQPYCCFMLKHWL
jgi:hypothetical protein